MPKCHPVLLLGRASKTPQTLGDFNLHSSELPEHLPNQFVNQINDCNFGLRVCRVRLAVGYTNSRLLSGSARLKQCRARTSSPPWQAGHGATGRPLGGELSW